MLIVGAKGFAKEVLEICHQNEDLENLVFYDDVNEDIGDYLYGKFPILKTTEQAYSYLKNIDPRFNLGIGNPILRKKLYLKFSELGGEFTTIISKTSVIGSYNNTINDGCNIMQKCSLTNSIYLGKGVLINQLSSIGHDVILGDFVEICPSVSVSGNCEIGKKTFIGTNSVILPDINIGENVIVGAGSVVTKNVPSNCTVVGIPAKIIKQNEA